MCIRDRIPASQAVQIIVQHVFARPEAERYRKISPADKGTHAQIRQMFAPDDSRPYGTRHADRERKMPRRFPQRVGKHIHPVAPCSDKADGFGERCEQQAVLPCHLRKRTGGKPCPLRLLRHRFPVSAAKDPLRADDGGDGLADRAGRHGPRLLTKGVFRDFAGLPRIALTAKIVPPAIPELRSDDVSDGIPLRRAAEGPFPGRYNELPARIHFKRNARLHGACDGKIRIGMVCSNAHCVFSAAHECGYGYRIHRFVRGNVRILSAADEPPVHPGGILPVRTDLQFRIFRFDEKLGTEFRIPRFFSVF